MVWLYHIFFVHSSMDGHLGCFHIWAVVNNAAVNMGVEIALQILLSVLWNECPQVKFLDYGVFLFFIFLGISILFSIAAVPFYIPTNAHGFQFLQTSTNTFHSVFYLSFFPPGYLNVCEVIYHCSFDLHFPVISGYICLLAILCIFFGYMYILWIYVYSSPLLIFN